MPALFGFAGHTRVIAVLASFGPMSVADLEEIIYAPPLYALRGDAKKMLRDIVERLASHGVAVCEPYLSLNRAHPAYRQIAALGRTLLRPHLSELRRYMPRRKVLEAAGDRQAIESCNLFGSLVRHETLLLVYATGKRGASAAEIAATLDVSHKSAGWALRSWLRIKVVRSESLTRTGHAQTVYTLNPDGPAHPRLEALLQRWLGFVEPQYRALAKKLGRRVQSHRPHGRRESF